MLDSNGKVPDHSDWLSITARSAPPPDSLPDAVRLVGDDLRRLTDDLQGAGSEMERFFTEQLRERPYAVLMTAAGIGYLLGGGLRSRITPLLFGVATRLATTILMRPSTKEGARREHETR